MRIEIFNKVMLVLAAFALFLLSGCAGGGDDDELVLNMNDSGTTHFVQPGDMIRILLDSNPSTGFAWELGNYDAGVLQEEGEPVYEAQGGMPGSGGRTTFLFTVKAPGETSLQLQYRRAWEQVPAERVFQVQLISE